MKLLIKGSEQRGYYITLSDLLNGVLTSIPINISKYLNINIEDCIKMFESNNANLELPPRFQNIEDAWSVIKELEPYLIMEKLT